MMRHWLTLFLRFVCVLAAIVIPGLLTLMTPAITYITQDYVSALWVWPVPAGLIAAGAAALFAIFLGWKILVVVDQRQLFSFLGIRLLRQLQFAFFGVFLLLASMLPYAFLIADAEDAPGLLLMVAVFPGISLVFSAVIALSRLLVEENMKIIASTNESLPD